MCSAAAGRSCTASARITRLLSIEDALERAEMRAGVPGRISEDHAAGLLYYLRVHGPQLRAHRARQHLQPAGALEVVERIEGLGDRRPDDDHAMTGEEQDAPAAQDGCHAVAISIVNHQAIVGAIVGNILVKAQRVVLDY